MPARPDRISRSWRRDAPFIDAVAVTRWRATGTVNDGSSLPRAQGVAFDIQERTNPKPWICDNPEG